MKRLAMGVLLASIAGAANAADLPASPSAPYSRDTVNPVIDWSGFYVGAMGGYANENTSDPFGLKGGFGGATVGYNWQFDAIVAGIEADGAFATSTTVRPSAALPRARTSMRWPRCAAG